MFLETPPPPNLTEARRLLNAGLKLVKLHPYTKQPIGIEWNKHSATSIDDDATGYGIPLTVNGLCSIDPDHMEMARVTMKAWCFDLDELLNAGVRTSSTRPDSGGRSAFLADPEGKARWLPFRVFDGQGRSLTLLELRAASMNLQDVVPGIIYANKDSGELYSQQYANEHRFDAAPTVPERFLALWRELSTNDDKLREYSRIAIDAIRDAGFKVNGDEPQYRPPMGGGVQLAFPAKGVRTEFNKAHTVDTILTRHGYTYHERKGRWAHPGATGAPAIRPIPGKEGLWQSDHGGDPLHGTFDAWAAHVQLDHAGDVDAAVTAWLWKDLPVVSEVMPKKSQEVTPVEQTMERLTHALPDSDERRQLAEVLLKAVDHLPPIEQTDWHKQLCHEMEWNQKAFSKIIKDLRNKWYDDQEVKTPAWAQGWYFVTRNDQFYNPSLGVEVSQTGFDNEFRRELNPNDNGNRPAAHRVALDDYRIPVVRDVIYMPQLGEVFSLNGKNCVNRFRPSSIPIPDKVLTEVGRVAVSLMDRHLMHICNNRVDVYQALLNWLAFVAQNPGKKVRWSPIIKGIEGDGKSILVQLLTTCLGGANVTSVMPKVIVSDYNGYAEGHCVVALEEIRMVGHNRYAAMDMLKPLITNDTVDIHRKGENNYNAPNVSNYIAFTNHSDALPLSNVDRRWMVIFTPWSDGAEMEQAVGQNLNEYFTRLQGALHDHGGALAHWLMSYPISSGFLPNAAAPVTQEKESMRVADKDDHEDTIEEIIESGCIGVSSKVLSTRHLTRALAKPTLSFQDVPQGKTLSRILQRLGWVRYPKQIKWQSEVCQIWTKGKPPEDNDALRAMLDTTLNSGER